MAGAPGEAVVVGAGPNGLAAAVTLARAGRRVVVYEAAPTPGGGTRTEALTMPGFLHDVCSAVHPLARASPCFGALPLEAHGLAWCHPAVLLAHPFDDGTAVALHHSVEATADGLGRDGPAWRALMQPFVDRWADLVPAVLGPPLRLPRHPALLARFALPALQPAARLARRTFGTRGARALLLGLAAHAPLPATAPPSAAFALTLALAGHCGGWPVARGGSHAITRALAAILRAHGGEIVTGRRVHRLDELPPTATTLLDLTPRQVLEIAGVRLPGRYRQALARYRYGAGVFKVDWALSAPIPWTAAPCRRAGTVHVGGDADAVERAMGALARGRCADEPFVILVQPTLADPSRAPAGRHTAWAYCHVPAGSTADMTAAVERQIERFAPGFSRVILARHTMAPAALEAHDANLVGGDIGGGVQDLRQWLARPVLRRNPYATPVPSLFLCSAATPPGGGVHGMCGFHAARAVLGRDT